VFDGLHNTEFKLGGSWRRSLLSLDSHRWSELRHAYGAAGDTPALLRELSSLPASDGDAEPWFSIWSSLAHQGDVYSASFAAVPHVVAALATAPSKADFSYFQFPAWVEVCRRQKLVPIPVDLEPAYAAALARLPRLVAEAATEPWTPELLSCALAAIAAAKGSASVAEAVLELSPEVADQFLEWLHDR
jgi:hypothetical protein